MQRQRKTRISTTEKLIRKELRYTRTMTVAKVSRVLANGWVELTPQLMMVKQNLDTGEETGVQMGELLRVPVGHFKMHGFVLTFPCKIGTEGIVIFSDRSLDLWKEKGEMVLPQDSRMHSVNDGVFMPIPTSNKSSIKNFNPDDMYIGREDGSGSVTVTPEGEVKLKSTTKIEMDAPNVKMIGALEVTSIVTAADYKVPGYPSYLEHPHSGVQTGSGISGGIAT